MYANSFLCVCNEGLTATSTGSSVIIFCYDWNPRKRTRNEIGITRHFDKEMTFISPSHRWRLVFLWDLEINDFVHHELGGNKVATASCRTTGSYNAAVDVLWIFCCRPIWKSGRSISGHTCFCSRVEQNTGAATLGRI